MTKCKLILLFLSIFITSQIVLGQLIEPTFDIISIPKFVGLELGQQIKVGTILNVGALELEMKNTGLVLSLSGVEVWRFMPAFDAYSNAITSFGGDGNLCIVYKLNGDPSCTGTHSMAANYLNILYPGSYGRKWGVVIQNNIGRMIWGRFGEPISSAGVMPLVPGNFIDRLNSNPLVVGLVDMPKFDYITNGMNILYINKESSSAVQFYSQLNGSPPVYTMGTRTNSVKYSLYFKSNTDLCIGEYLDKSKTIWCNGITGEDQRYVVIPINTYTDTTSKSWVVLNSLKKLTFGRVGSFVLGVNYLTSFPSSNQIENEMLKLTFNKDSGDVKFINKFDGSTLKTVHSEVPITTNNCLASMTLHNDQFSFKCLSKSGDKNMFSEDAQVVHLIFKKSTSFYRSAYDSYITDKATFGLVNGIPEAILVDNSGFIIDHSSVF